VLPNPSRLLLAALVGTSLALAACTGAASTLAPTAARTAAASPTDAMMSHAPSAAAASGPVTAGMGTFHKVHADATGTAALLHLADGTFTVSFEDFTISASQGIDVILVANMDVTKDADVDQTRILDLGPLKAPSGMQEFPIPAAMTSAAMAYHTVVLWDLGMKHAVAAAPLK
jgi:hypothetical protein